MLSSSGGPPRSNNCVKPLKHQSDGGAYTVPKADKVATRARGSLSEAPSATFPLLVIVPRAYTQSVCSVVSHPAAQHAPHLPYSSHFPCRNLLSLQLHTTHLHVDQNTRPDMWLVAVMVAMVPCVDQSFVHTICNGSHRPLTPVSLTT